MNLASQGQQLDPRVMRIMSAIAVAVSLGILFIPPVAQLYYTFQFNRATISAEANFHSRIVSQVVGRNPQMWQFETLRISEMLLGGNKDELVQVFTSEGVLAAEAGPSALPAPKTSVTKPIFDSGVQVGTVKITISLRDLFYNFILTFAVCGIIAWGVFLTLKTLPLRMLRQMIDRASFLASHDPLTKLPNRSLFHEWLDQSIKDVNAQKTSLAILCLDFDHFKEVNDLLGHAAGDDLLRQAVDRMTNALADGDILSRLGGDEFALIQKNVAQPNGALQLAETLNTVMAQPFDLDGHEVLIGTSIGISIFEAGADSDGECLLQQSDLALYRAKSEGRGNFRFYENEMNEQLVSRKRMESDLRKALPEGQFALHFQPQIDLSKNEISGVEALLRWQHPTEGFIPPDRFIPLAEDTGLIFPIGDWVIHEACRCAADWPNLKVAINVSPVQFRLGDLVATIRTALEETGMAPERLEIEITEGVLLQYTEETIATLGEIKSLGVRIAMDDFGTGYSSLSYLRRFPFDKIKIDRSFVSGLGADEDVTKIIAAVIALGESLGMLTNAEGVETALQADLLRQQGCQEVQGFYFGRPMPSEAICELLMAFSCDDLAANENAILCVKTAQAGAAFQP